MRINTDRLLFKKMYITISLFLVVMLLFGCGKKSDAEVEEQVAEEVMAEATDDEVKPTVISDEEDEKTDAEDGDYAAIYADVLDEYYYYIVSGGKTEFTVEGTSGVLEAAIYADGPETSDIIGYQIMDFDSDDIPELVIGCVEGENEHGGYGKDIYSVYGCKEGTPKCILEGWARNRYWVVGDNQFANFGSGGYAYSCFGTFHIKDSTSLECDNFYFTDLAENMEDLILYQNTTGAWDADASDILDCSEEEFWQMEDELEAGYQEISLTAFSNYKPVKTMDQVNLNSDVFGNDRYFVQTGGRVYFHAPDQNDMGSTALWSDFIGADNGDTILYSVDVEDNDVRKEAEDHAWGKMSKSGDFLFFNGYTYVNDEPEENLSYFSPNGELYSDCETLGENYLGGDQSGHYVVAYTYNNNDTGYAYDIWIHKDGALMEGVRLYGYPNTVGVINNSYIFVVSEEKDDYVYYLKELNLDTSEIINLGALPEAEYGWYEVNQVEFVEDEVYFSYGNYDGTGHFYQGGYYISAKLGVPDSVTYEDQSLVDTNGEYAITSIPFRVDNGKIMTCNGIPGSADIIDNEIGYYNEMGTWIPVVSDAFEPLQGDNDEIIRNNEAVELLGNYIYVISDVSKHVPEDDVGWRYAYVRLQTEIFRIDIRNGEKTTLFETTR